MSLEGTIFATLRGLVDDAVYRIVALPTAARPTVPTPRIVFQQVGGDAINFLTGDRPSKKWARIQVSCWATRHDDVTALAHAAEDAMRAETDLGTRVLGAPIVVYENDTKLFGTHQDFSVIFDD